MGLMHINKRSLTIRITSCCVTYGKKKRRNQPFAALCAQELLPLWIRVRFIMRTHLRTRLKIMATQWTDVHHSASMITLAIEYVLIKEKNHAAKSGDPPPGQRPPGQRPLQRDPPCRETPPAQRPLSWTETPLLHRDPLLDRDPHWTETPQTETPTG